MNGRGLATLAAKYARTERLASPSQEAAGAS